MGKYQKGIDFEIEACERISKELNSRYIFDYYLIQDVAYKGMSYYEQVDCMLVCSYGVFCIEMKNWNGEVRPNNDDKWNIYYNGKKTNREFTNPIKQNERHCACLKYMLDKYYPAFSKYNIPVISIILFSDNTKILNSSKENVMYIGNLSEYILNHNMHIPDAICEGVVQVIRKIKEQALPEYQRLHKHQIDTLKH